MSNTTKKTFPVLGMSGVACANGAENFATDNLTVVYLSSQFKKVI